MTISPEYLKEKFLYRLSALTVESDLEYERDPEYLQKINYYALINYDQFGPYISALQDVFSKHGKSIKFQSRFIDLLADLTNKTFNHFTNVHSECIELLLQVFRLVAQSRDKTNLNKAKTLVIHYKKHLIYPEMITKKLNDIVGNVIPIHTNGPLKAGERFMKLMEHLVTIQYQKEEIPIENQRSEEYLNLLKQELEIRQKLVRFHTKQMAEIDDESEPLKKEVASFNEINSISKQKILSLLDDDDDLGDDDDE